MLFFVQQLAGKVVRVDAIRMQRERFSRYGRARSRLPKPMMPPGTVQKEGPEAGEHGAVQDLRVHGLRPQQGIPRFLSQ
jgi:hypothetical protein